MSRRLLALVSFAALLALSGPARALPEIYAGLGATSAGKPAKLSDVGFALHGGVDDLIGDWGVGGQLDFIGLDPSLTAELRYSVLSIPFVRLYAGAELGLRGISTSVSGAGGVFAGVRLSVGVPYLGLKLGYGYNGGGFAPSGLLSLGACF